MNRIKKNTTSLPARTINIKTGKRSWGLTTCSKVGNAYVLVSDSGKEYVISHGTMSATRKGRDGETKLYTWSVTNWKSVRAALAAVASKAKRQSAPLVRAA